MREETVGNLPYHYNSSWKGSKNHINGSLKIFIFFFCVCVRGGQGDQMNLFCSMLFHVSCNLEHFSFSFEEKSLYQTVHVQTERSINLSV